MSLDQIKFFENEIQQKKREIKHLQDKILVIQINCKHDFTESTDIDFVICNNCHLEKSVFEE